MARPKGSKSNSGSSCSKGCMPAVIYGLLAFGGIALAIVENPKALETSGGLIHLAIQIATALFWTMVMYWLCSVCYKGVAWFLLLFPLLIGLAMVWYVVMHGKKHMWWHEVL